MRFGVSYYGTRHIQQFQKDLKEIAQSGFSIVVWTFSEEDYWYYRGTAQEGVKIARSEGLESWIDPWGVGGIFGGEAFSYWALRYLETCQKGKDGRILPALCPNRPHTRKLLRLWLEAAMELQPNAIFFDEPHFFLKTLQPYPDEIRGCYCAICQEKFEEGYGDDIFTAQPAFVQQFQHESIQDFLTAMGKEMEQNGVSSALCLLPNCPEEFLPYYATFPSLKSLGASPYWIHHSQPISWFHTEAQKIVNACKSVEGVAPHIWLQAFRIPAGREMELLEGVKVAAELGIQTVLFWGYHACDFVSYLRPDNPQEVWNTILKLVEQLR